MINIEYTWKHREHGIVKGVITYLNINQLLRDEMKMMVEMMKAGFSLESKETKYIVDKSNVDLQSIDKGDKE